MNAIESLRPELEPLPGRIGVLPVHRGYPVPWFVDWADGVPEFRAMDPAKWMRAVIDRLCWVCGEKLGRFMSFVSGPMCGINRTSSEPPCHYECAAWSARNCPFLSRPNAVRRDNDGFGDASTVPGFGLTRNPGVVLLWTTKSYSLFGDGRGGRLIRMGDPTSVEWWAEAKPATRAQVEESIRGGAAVALEHRGGARRGRLAQRIRPPFSAALAQGMTS